MGDRAYQAAAPRLWNALPNHLRQIFLQIKKQLEPVQRENGRVKENPTTCPCLMSCTIFLSYTSNLISSGLRETIRYLVQHQMVQLTLMLCTGTFFCFHFIVDFSMRI
uniref:Uncharacterized protein n=1 Tax=Neogobius melanostomus TaxID=47308 RepID=A0A8C6WTH3_9GOBI